MGSSRNSLLLLCLLIGIIPFQACMRSSPNGQIGQSSVTYDTEIDKQALKLFAESCDSCHGSSSPGLGGLKSTDNLKALIDNGYIVPGDVNGSPLFQEVESGSMPPSSPLGAPDQEFLATWIESLTDRGKDSGKAPVESITFTRLFSEVIEPRCTTCHDSSHVLPLNNYESVREIVWAESPSVSLLWSSPAAGRMPKTGPALTASELKKINDWIELGALNN